MKGEFMKYLKRFILMIQFLTTIPLRMNLNVTQEDYGKGLVFAPIVGLIIGGVLAGAWFVLDMVFPALVTAVIIVVLYILLTGGLHMDGLGDTFDGLFSNKPKDRMLEIMRDSRLGTNALLAVVSVVLLDTALIASYDRNILFKVLLLMPVAGRMGSLIGSGVSVYARSGEGLGKSFIDYCGIKEMLVGFIACLIIFYLSAGVSGIVIAIIPPVTAFVTVKFFSRKIGGATGDILGAVCEINQTVFLLAVFLLPKLTGVMI